MELDRFDRQLINLVQENADRTSEELAELVALSPSAIQRRLRKLRDRGVIIKSVALANPQLIGRPTFFVVALHVERERPEMLAQLRKWLTNEPHVQQAFYVTGEADFVVVITAPDVDTYDDLVSRLMIENTNVKRFTTNVALSVVKRGVAIPVSE